MCKLSRQPLRHEESRDIKIGGDAPGPAFRIGLRGLEAAALFGDLFDAVLGQSVERQRRARERGKCRQLAAAVREIQAALARLLGFVAPVEMLRGLFVVAGQRLVGGVGNAVAQHLQVEHTEQRIAAADAGVEEAERKAGVDRLDPERDLGQFHRHRVAVHPVQAARGPHRAGRGGSRPPKRAPSARMRASRVAMRRAAASRKWPEPQAGSMT